MVNKAGADKAGLNHHRHMRGKVTDTAERPRLNVFRSAKNIYARTIDDVAGVTPVAISTLDKESTGNGGNKEAVKQADELIAKRAAEKGTTEVVFDRGSYILHGHAKELAEGAREGSLKF